MAELNPAALTNQQPQGQNLVNLTKAELSSEPPGFWRALVLDCLGVAAALFFGYSYFRYLTVGASPWYILIGLVIFSLTSGLQMFLEKSVWRRTGIIVGESVAMVIAFAFYDAIPVVLVVGGILVALLLWGYLEGRFEVQNEVEIHFFKATRGAIGKIASGAILFFLIVYAPQAQGKGIFIPRSSFRTLFAWSANVFDNAYPNLTLNGTFGDFAKGFARAEFENNPSFAALPASAQDQALNQAVAQFSASVKESTGVAPSPTTPMSDIAYDYIVATLAGWQDKFPNQFVVIWVVVLFLVFRFVGYLFVFFVQLLLLLVYEGLLATGFMRIEGVPQTKETVQY